MDRGARPTRSSSPFRRPVVPSPLATALGPRPPDRGPASIVGLEHEYSLSSNGERVDFRTLIHGLSLGGRRLDPGDANAYRLPSGLVLTCDAEDAEVVDSAAVAVGQRRRERRQADGDVLGPFGVGRRVSHPLAGGHHDGLAGANVQVS